jgi:hypothetical protein
MRTMMALLSAAGLCAHAAVAQAQGAPAPAKPASAATAAPTAKRLPNPSTAGMGLSAMEGDSEGCPRDANGEEQCTVEVTGSGAGWKGASGSGGSSAGDGSAMCQPSKVLQAAPCTPDTPGGRGEVESDKAAKRLEAIKNCQDTYKRGVRTVEDRFNNRTASCIAKNGGGIGPITYGVIDDFLGVFGASCYDRALKDHDTEMKNVNAANLDCLQKAQND